VIPKHRHPRLASPTGSSVAPESLGWSSLLGMGAATAAILIVGLGVGWLVDNLANTSPIFLLIGVALGILGAVSFSVVKFRTYLDTSHTPKSDPK
jgi:ATP synthase protein I